MSEILGEEFSRGLPAGHYSPTGTLLNIKFVTMCLLISYRVLRLSDGLGEPGAVNWDLALCLLLSWILCFVCIVKGVKISGKVFNCAFVRAFCAL